MKKLLGFHWRSIIMGIVFLLISCTAAKNDGEADPPALFTDAQSSDTSAPQPYIVRSRFVKVNISLLVDEEGRLRDLQPGTKILLNLFPDTTYVGLISQFDENGPASYSWSGSLENVEFGEMLIVLSDGVFIAHVASPGGVYEVQFKGEDLYQVVEIDQTKLPQD